MSRREYEIDFITVNSNPVNKVIIDSHYELKHSESVNDELILRLVNRLNGRIEVPEAIDDGFRYFNTLLELDGKQYRLIWLLEEDEIYIGVVNTYRDDRKE